MNFDGTESAVFRPVALLVLFGAVLYAFPQVLSSQEVAATTAALRQDSDAKKAAARLARLRRDLQKLAPVKAEVKGIPVAFDDLAGHLVAMTKAPKSGGKVVQNAIGYKLFNRDNLVAKALGKAAVVYNKGARKPRLDDEKDLVKSLIIGNDRGGHLKGCRYISFKLRVRATHQKDEESKVVLVGDEAADFVILEDPEDGTLWLLMDWERYRKGHRSVASLVLEEEDEEKDEKKSKNKTKRPENPNLAKVTRIASVDLDSAGITIRFRRTWERRDNAMIDGTFEVKFNSTLDASLFYHFGSKKLRAAYFHKGFAPSRGKK